MSGRELLEQLFENDKADFTLKNKDHQEDNTNFFSLAGKMVDNV